MNILLDGHFLDKKKEGSRTFIYSFLEGLVRIGKSDPQLAELFSFVVPVFQPEYWQRHFTDLGHVRFVGTFRQSLLRNHFDLPLKAATSSADILQAIYYLPFCLPPKVKKVLIIHDVLPFSHPQYFSRFFRFKFKKMVHLAQRQADIIVCGSDFSKTAIRNTFSIDENRLRVIPYGIHIERFASDPGSEDLSDFRAGFPASPFILVVGRLDPRKGLRLVLDLFSRLRRDQDIRLVLVGGREVLPEAEMREIASLQAAGRLLWFQNISDAALTRLYRKARLLLFFPAVEGFGLPVLEAMAAGVPYLTMPLGGLKEIAIAEAWVEAQDVEQTVRRAERLLGDEVERERFIAKGREQVQKFHCENMVRNYLQLYQEW